jgi:hypothetical protein
MLLIKGTLAKYPFILMADALYILKLRMTQNITKVINEEEKMMLDSGSLHLHLLCSMVYQVYMVTYQSPLK